MTDVEQVSTTIQDRPLTHFHWSTLLSRRMWVLLILSFTSGLPYALAVTTLQAWYTDTGMTLIVIGSISLIGYPYLLKPLWAPLLDRFKPVGLGRRRGWIFIMQAGMCLSVLAMACINPIVHPWLLLVFGFILTVFSATQDSAIDAYRTELLRPEERGFGSTIYSVGYRIGLLVSGSLALVMVSWVGWQMVYWLMALCLFIPFVVTMFAPKTLITAPEPQTMRDAIINPVREFFTRPYAIWILIFIVIYKLCDAFANTMTTPFLLRELHFSLAVVGAVSKSVSLLAGLIGAFVAGLCYVRLGLYRSLLYFGIAQMLSNLAFMWLAIVGKNYEVMVISLFFENFCGGLSTVAFVALLTSLCDARYTATQFAGFTALSAVGRVNAGPQAALLIAHLGWIGFYFSTVLMGLPSLILLIWLNRKVYFDRM